MGTKTGIPGSYKMASWRCTLPGSGHPGKKELAVGFNVVGGGVVRLRLDHKSAKNLFESISEYLYPDSLSQKDRSSGMSSVSGSIPEEGQQV